MAKVSVRRALAAVVGAIFLLPLVMGGLASLSLAGQAAPQNLGALLREWSWQNYAEVFQMIPLGQHLWNSLLVVIVSVPFSVLVASLAAFFLIRSNQPWRRWLVAFAIVTMLVPPSAVWLFRFQLLSRVGLVDTRLALMLSAFAGGSSLFVLIYFWAWRQAPADLFDAADIDGASFLQAWWQVALPLVRPATAAVTLLAFMFFWGNFIEPVLFIYDPNKYTLPIGLQLLNQLDASNRPLLLAGAMIAIVPPMLLFLITQRWFLQGEWTR
ncbi:MAG: carbohydrate ABC transporter permease [Chloroflexota bacterium]